MNQSRKSRAGEVRSFQLPASDEKSIEALRLKQVLQLMHFLKRECYLPQAVSRVIICEFFKKAKKIKQEWSHDGN